MAGESGDKSENLPTTVHGGRGNASVESARACLTGPPRTHSDGVGRITKALETSGKRAPMISVSGQGLEVSTWDIQERVSRQDRLPLQGNNRVDEGQVKGRHRIAV